MKSSAGILMYRHGRTGLEVFLVHPGGPYWARKDAGAWSIPKGECNGEQADLLAEARREFQEETGYPIEGHFEPLQPITQAGGKTVHAWAIEGDIDVDQLSSNMFSMEWPPHSGKQREFPEVDRGAWFTLDEAGMRILPSQRPLLTQLRAVVKAD
jgi:predicted NUDIX family NTP pyrophosphohydrolase